MQRTFLLVRMQQAAPRTIEEVDACCLTNHQVVRTANALSRITVKGEALFNKEGFALFFLNINKRFICNANQTV